jgi:TolB-like protein/DNA-binding winged helix-turn-helix (wHTH) protein
MDPAPSPPTIKFGPYVVDLRAGELRKFGAKVRLQEKPLQLLAALAEQPGQVVTREDLRRRLWPGDTFVDFETGLNTAVSKLRDALSDSAEKPRYIETIPRRGYRFLFPVEQIAAGNGSVVPASFPAVPSTTSAGEIAPANAIPDFTEAPPSDIIAKRSSSGRIAALGFLLACVAIGSAGYFTWKHRSRPIPPPVRAMLVVLPFANLTGDPEQDYVSDGFTEEMITQLGELNHDQMGVIARTSAMSYKGGSKSIKQIAEELGVNYALEGSLRKNGDGFRVTVQLIRADDQTHLWAHEYDRSRDDLARLEGELAQDIAREVQIKLTPQAQLAMSKAHSVAPEAYRNYLKGRYNLNKRSPEGMRNAIAAFQQAIQEDPGYAPAYSGLADTYNLLIFYGFPPGRDGIPMARAAAEKAVELDGTLAEGRASLGYVNFMWDANWAKAENQFQRAIELDDSYSPAHHWYALYLAALGRRNASLQQIQQSQRLDPLSLIVTTAAAYVSYFARDYSAASALCEQALRRDPNFMVAHAVLGLTLEQQDKPEEAIAQFEKTLQLSGGRPAPYLDYLGHAYAAANQRAKAEAILVELDGAITPGGASPMYRAATLAALGRNDEAMDAAEEGFERGGAEKVWLKVDPRYEPLRSNPRYERLVHVAGLGQ